MRESRGLCTLLSNSSRDFISSAKGVTSRGDFAIFHAVAALKPGTDTGVQ